MLIILDSILCFYDCQYAFQLFLESNLAFWLLDSFQKKGAAYFLLVTLLSLYRQKMLTLLYLKNLNISTGIIMASVGPINSTMLLELSTQTT